MLDSWLRTSSLPVTLEGANSAPRSRLRQCCSVSGYRDEGERARLNFQFPWRAIPGFQEWLDVILFYRPVRLVPIEPGFMPHRKVSQDAGRRRPHAGLDVARGPGARLDAFDEVLPVRNVQIAHLRIVLVCLRLDFRPSIGNQPAAA